MKKHFLTLFLIMISISQAEASSCQELNSNLRFGMRGDAVSALQNYLHQEQFLSAEPTGYFGTLTLKAVHSFQKKYSIEATGFVGPLTRAQIKSTSCQAPVACTALARLCPDGSNMPRSTSTCEWYPNKCPQVTTPLGNSTSTYTPVATSSSTSVLDALRQALGSVGVSFGAFATTTMTEKEILDMTRQFELEYILNK